MDQQHGQDRSDLRCHRDGFHRPLHTDVQGAQGFDLHAGVSMLGPGGQTCDVEIETEFGRVLQLVHISPITQIRSPIASESAMD
ncbi:hypothetical protein SGFS_074030 [Streptomyces graminofaciens]|uniref:Uncharacterized protein n=1 Tax=Streptomyces graminofaciens TaxID=68212 RepID=A0ABM7FGD0_9ACTN|nr:hypothetical protein SGFS_074030 [Streptomyces graminofaciens]